MTLPKHGIFIAQGAGLRMMADLALALDMQRVGLYASHSAWYRQYIQRAPHLERPPFIVAHEWEVTQNPPPLDMAVLKRFDDLFGPGELWRALITDRRMVLGPFAVLQQDYRRRYSDEQLLRILQGHLVAFERLWEAVQPQCVVAYNCVTVEDYLAYLFARAYDVPYHNLRAIKIRDYVQYEPTPRQTSYTTCPVYEERLQNAPDDDYTRIAREHIRHVREQNALYEGVRKAASSEWQMQAPLKTLTGLLRQEWEYRRGPVPHDNHLVSPIRAVVTTRIINRLRVRRHDRALAAHYVQEQDLPGIDYVFFPLHSEPEVALLVNAKPYLNQIEVVRNLASSLPIGTKLLVKDHPLAYSRRSGGYYRKLLAIPNVRLIHPSVKSRPIIRSARAVVVITGSIGLEAVIMGKPVACLSDPPYSLLPDTMVHHLSQPDRFDRELHDLMTGYTPDENALEQLLAAQISQAASVKLYSVLLGRRNVVTTGDSSYTDEIEKLAAYTRRVLSRAGTP